MYIFICPLHVPSYALEIRLSILRVIQCPEFSIIRLIARVDAPSWNISLGPFSQRSIH